MNTDSTTLHPRLAELVDDLHRSRRALHACVAALSDAQRLAAPVGASWSVAQIVEHLSMVEGNVGRLLSNLMKEAEATGARETETTSVLTSLDQFGVDVPTVRIPAPDRVQPKEGLTTHEALARLDAVRDHLLSVLPRASGLPLATVSFPHPALGPLNGYEWILLIAQHERRHTRQIEAVAAASASA